MTHDQYSAYTRQAADLARAAQEFAALAEEVEKAAATADLPDIFDFGEESAARKRVKPTLALARAAATLAAQVADADDSALRLAMECTDANNAEIERATGKAHTTVLRHRKRTTSTKN